MTLRDAGEMRVHPRRDGVGACRVGACRVGECHVGECHVGECHVGVRRHEADRQRRALVSRARLCEELLGDARRQRPAGRIAIGGGQGTDAIQGDAKHMTSLVHANALPHAPE